MFMSAIKGEKFRAITTSNISLCNLLLVSLSDICIIHILHHSYLLETSYGLAIDKEQTKHLQNK